MKSLEHIIREIREGKNAREKKKDSLEHTIRKVANKEYESSFGAKDSKPVDEDVGGLIGSGTGGEPKLHAEDGKKKKTDEAVGSIGTDKFQGNQFKSVRTSTPHIQPPAGPDSHSQAPENVSRQRTLAKEKGSMTIHGKVTESSRTRFAEPVADLLSTLWRSAPTAGKEVSPYVKKELKARTKSKELVPTKPAELPSKVEPKTEVPTKVDTETQTAPKVDTKTPTQTLNVPKTPTDTKVQTVVDPKIVTGVKTQTAVEPKVATKTPVAPEEPKTKPRAFPFGLGSGFMDRHDIDYTVSHLHRPKINIGHAKNAKKHAMKEESERKEIENMPRKGDRKSIEYVGRKDSDPKTSKQKTSRLATIKNVIDEAKKIKVEDGKTKAYDYGDDILVINPDQRKINLDVENGEKIPNDYK